MSIWMIVILFLVLVVGLLIGQRIGVRGVGGNKNRKGETCTPVGTGGGGGDGVITTTTTTETTTEDGGRVIRDLAEVIKRQVEFQERVERKHNEEELAKYANSRINNLAPPGFIRSSTVDENAPANIRKDVRIAIPFGLSAMEKKLLEEFYNE